MTKTTYIPETRPLFDIWILLFLFIIPLLIGCSSSNDSVTSGGGFVRASTINVQGDKTGSVTKALTSIQEPYLSAMEAHIHTIRIGAITSPLSDEPGAQYNNAGVITIANPHVGQYTLINVLIHELSHVASHRNNPEYGQDAARAAAGRIAWIDTPEEMQAIEGVKIYRGKAAGFSWLPTIL